MVQVASVGQHWVHFEGLQLTRNFDPLVADRRSKLALIMGVLIGPNVRSVRISTACIRLATCRPT